MAMPGLMYLSSPEKKKISNLLETVAPTPEKEGRQKPRRDGGVRQAKKTAKS